MSDLLEIDERCREGASWRGTETLSFGEDDLEYTYRNLPIEEFSEVLDTIGRERFEQFQEQLGAEGAEDADGSSEGNEDEDTESELTKDEMLRYRKLQSKSDEGRLSSEEEDELEDLKAQMQDLGINPFDMLNPEMARGMKLATKKGVEPDDEDVSDVMGLTAAEHRERFGEILKTGDEAREVLSDEKNGLGASIAENSTFDDMAVFEIGLTVIESSMGGEGN